MIIGLHHPPTTTAFEQYRAILTSAILTNHDFPPERCQLVKTQFKCFVRCSWSQNSKIVLSAADFATRVIIGTSSRVSDLEQVAIILIINLSLSLYSSSFQVVTFLPEG